MYNGLEGAYHEASIRVQAGMRGLDRRRELHRRDQALKGAADTIQGGIRGFEDRRDTSRLVEEYEYELAGEEGDDPRP